MSEKKALSDEKATSEKKAASDAAILFEKVDGVGLITFNRPDTLNTFSGEMMDGLGDLYRRCDEDDEVRVIVVTGSGKAFCAGADLTGGDAFDTQADMEFSSCPLSTNAWDLRKPVIAAVNGHAIGVGLGIASQADLRVFAEEGKYGFLQVRRGVVADFAIHHSLPRLIGLENALDLICSGRRINGIEAGEMGLAKRVVPAAEVLNTAMALAKEMARDCSPLTMGIAKQLIIRGQNMSLAEMETLETKMLHYTMGRPDALEGGMAFFEKRAPNWTSSVSAEWPDDLPVPTETAGKE